jgi:carbonic anhydrase
MPAKIKLNSFLMSFLVLSLVACSSISPDVAENDAVKKEIAKEERTSNEVHTAHWSYEGKTGSEHWGDINPEYAVCTKGKEQSPINIEISQVIKDEKIAEPVIHYKPTMFSLSNNGHTIQGNLSTLDNSIVVDNKEYKLTQFHFHTPSEHEFNGQNFDMEIHFVHQDANKQFTVLGVIIKEGASNPYLEKAWDVIPTEKTTEDIKLTEPINLMSLLPTNKDSFQYNGSLTTPPCSEGVKWVVLEEPIEMSKEQINKFRNIFPDNHRPVQSFNERKVKED